MNTENQPTSIPTQPTPTPATAVATTGAISSPALQKVTFDVSKVIGTVEVLTDSEQMELMACEAVIETGWATFVQVGLALARIREARLYKVEFATFDAYCREKWAYSRDYADRLISAAQVFTHLTTNCQERKPDHESQLRPLIGLTPEQAQLAWEHAVKRAAGRRITTRLVKNAVQVLKLAKSNKPDKREARPTKADHRRHIGDAFGQFMVLLSQKASHDVLREKVEALYGYFQALIPKPVKR